MTVLSYSFGSTARWLLAIVISHSALAGTRSWRTMFAVACSNHPQHHEGNNDNNNNNIIRHGRFLSEGKAREWSSRNPDSSLYSSVPHHHHHHGNPNKDIVLPEEGMQQLQLCGSREPTLTERLQMGIASAEYDLNEQLLEEVEANSPYQSILAEKRKRKQIIIIPVYFHVFLKNETYGRLTLKQIKAGFMAPLHKAFKRSGIRFRLKKVVRKVNATWFKCDDDARYKTLVRQGGPETLNVFVCDMASKGLGGTAYVPPIVESHPHLDGVNIMNPALGQAEFAYQAFIHEVGHWMGLVHTFVDGCDSQPGYYWNYPDYYFTGDGVNDTAAQAKPTWEYKQQSYCWENDALNTCPDDVAGVDKGLDPIDNYMNYLPGECFREYGRFTPGQIQRMKAQYYGWRAPNSSLTRRGRT